MPINAPVTDACIDACIPSYHPGRSLMELLDLLHVQKRALRKILLVQTGREGLDELLKREGMDTDSFLAKYPLVTLRYIGEDEFDHGATRDMAMQLLCDAEYVLMMTEDAVPYDDELTERLLSGFYAHPEKTGVRNEKTAAVYARQIARPEAGEAEKYTRMFNYPEEPRLKGLDDVPELGIKTFFCSNVCAMYRRDIYDIAGGFPKGTPFNEDMIYAGHAVSAGYLIYYAADAVVIHSHDYTAVQQFRRNFDLGASQADHPEVFGSVSSQGEGMKLVVAAAGHLLKKGRIKELFHFAAGCAGRYLGYKKGKNYKELSQEKILKYTMNRVYWTRRFAGGRFGDQS